MGQPTTVLILGANSDVAKEMLRIYVQRGDFVIAASRNTTELQAFAAQNKLPQANVDIRFWDDERALCRGGFHAELGGDGPQE